MKGAFRLVTPKKGDFSNVETRYREDRRHFSVPLSVHELQNLHLRSPKYTWSRRNKGSFPQFSENQ